MSCHNILIEVFAYLMKCGVEGNYIDKFDIVNGKIVNWKLSQHIPTKQELDKLTKKELDDAFKKYLDQNNYFIPN